MTMPAKADARRCGSCLHFRNDPAFLEASLPGLTVMGSGYASVVADDGICARHDRYLGARSSCADWRARLQLTET
jgi:hypothetical protein